jgi:lambda repressor-like predicted transcriptional regulator/Zn-dependent peptidase ImmA (M78 family)
MRHVISDYILKKAYSDYKKGMSLRELGHKYGFSDQAFIFRFRKKFKDYQGIAKSRYRGNKLSRKDLEEIFDRYKKGESSRSLGMKYGVHPTSIQQALLRTYGNSYQNISEKRLKNVVTKDFIQKAFEEYKKGKSVYSLAKKYRISDEILYRWFKKFPEHHNISEQRKDIQRIDNKKVKLMFQEYKKAGSLERVSKKFNISRNAIARHLGELPEYKILRDRNLRRASIRNLNMATKKNKKVTKKTISQMIELRKKGKTVYEIADLLGINSVTVIYYLRKDFPQYVPFDAAKYLRYKGEFGGELMRKFLELLKLEYTSQKILSNGKKPDFIVDGNCFLEVKSRFLNQKEYDEVVRKYLGAKEIKRGMIIAYYGYSRHIKKHPKVTVLGINGILQILNGSGENDLIKELRGFADLTFEKWQVAKKERSQSSLKSYVT